MSVETVWRLIDSGRLIEAEAICKDALVANPSHLEATFALAVIAFHRAELDSALALVQQVLSIDENVLPALTLGVKILVQRDRFMEAIFYAKRAYALKPGDLAILQSIGRCFAALSKPFEALQAYDAIVQLHPHSPVGYFGLTELFTQVGSSFDAVEALARGLKLSSNRSRRLNLAELELGLGRPRNALEAAQKILAEEPEDLSANLIAARSLTEMGERESAELFWLAAFKNTTDGWRVHRQKAYALSMSGDFKASEECLKQSCKEQPIQGAAYQLMFGGRKVVDSDRNLICFLESLPADPRLEVDERAPLQFALGKAWHDLHEPERAIKHFDRANEIRLKEREAKRPYRPAMMVDQGRLYRELFPKPGPSSNRKADSVPIFVVGMMRSGTTLIEQILASHPQVVGAGELDFWSGSEPLIIDFESRTIREEMVAERGSAYLRLLNSLGGGGLRVVDKNPANLQAAGLLNRVFPDSPIIHLHRNPVDTALSIWMTDASAPFMSSKKNIVEAIRLASKQAAHWRKVLPDNRFLDLRYEDLVRDPEQWTRRLLEFCNLAWDDQCLRANELSKNVKTPSLWQVRQPIYETSVARWKRYEPWLGEFLELVDASQPPER